MAKKDNSLDQALADIDKEWGTGSIFRMSESPELDIECVSTGILPLDLALGARRGLPRGRLTEIYGAQGAGKTTIVLMTLAEAQRQGHTCAFVDAEAALDPIYAAALGVDVDSLLISQPGTGEEAFYILEKLAQTNSVSFVGVDSVAALLPRAMIEGSYGDAFVGMHPKFMSQSLGKLKGIANEGNMGVLFINQIRKSIGVTYGSGEYTPGGQALGFYASVRLDARRIETIKDADKNPLANRTRVKVIKNKIGLPYRQCEFDLEYGIGVPPEGCLIDLALDLGLIVQKGAWFATDYGESLAQGREKLKEKLRTDRDLFDGLDKRVREAVDAV